MTIGQLAVYAFVRRRLARVGFVAVLLAGTPTARATDKQPADLAAAEFLADKPADLVAVVTIQKVETRWTVIEHGDHVPVLRVRSSIDRLLLGRDLAPGDDIAAMHFDYTDMIFEEISPPPVIGQRYLLLANPVPAAADEWLDPIEVDWLVLPQGAHRLRGAEDRRFIYWQGRRHPLAGIESLLRQGATMPLAVIADPETRLRVAQQRLQESRIDDPAEFVRGVAALVEVPRERRAADPAAVPFERWYEALSVLRRLGGHEEHRSVVAAGLRRLADTAGDHRRVVIALLLAELGDATGRQRLEGALAGEDVELNRAPDGSLSLPGRLPYDDSSVAAAAYALGRLGSTRGLSHPEIDVRLAAADGLAAQGGEEARAELRSIVSELDETVSEMAGNGELSAKREAGDYQQRYPAQWVKAHQLLSRMGDDRSLQALVDANRTDWATYPESETAVHPRLQVATWTTAPHQWPSLGEALAAADADRARLLARLESLHGEAASWQDSVLASMRGWLLDEPPADPTPAPEEDRTEILARIEELIGSSDPGSRAQGLAGAGYQRVEAHFDQVLRVALEGSGIERQAALYGLGFYRRQLPEETLRRLSREGSLAHRVSGLELATRWQPEPFAGEAMALLAELLAEPAEDGGMEDFERQTMVRQYPRLLTRFCRDEIPAAILAGLDDESERVRLAVVEALGLGGNPSAAAPLRRAAADADERTGRAIQWALERLGPEE